MLTGDSSSSLPPDAQSATQPSGTLFDPRAPMYTRVSGAAEQVHTIATIGVVGTALTILMAIVIAILPKCDWSQVAIASLAAAWAIGAPMWFFYEYFYIYRENGAPNSWEQFKHGQQVSAAVWAGLAASLTVFASSDFIKPKTDKYICEFLSGGASAPNPTDAVLAKCRKDG